MPLRDELVRRVRAGAARAGRRGRVRAADRLRERREPAAGARRGARSAKSRSASRSAPPRARVIRQLLTESFVLGALGGAAGLLVAAWGLALLVALSPVDLADARDRALELPGARVHRPLVSLLTAIVCGLAPAFEGSRTDVHETLKDGARAGRRRRASSAHAAGLRRLRNRARRRAAGRRRPHAAQLRLAPRASIPASTPRTF